MRGYDEFLGRIFETVPAWLTLLILLAVTALAAAGWYFHPRWIPRRLPRFSFRWPRLRLPRLPRRRRGARHGRGKPRPARTAARTTDTRPGRGAGRADQLAAEGRYAEAIRERLRDTVADLTRAGIVTPEPGTTAVELATEAGTDRPAVGPALTGATGLFSEIWYGHRPAGRPEDDRMRDLTAQVSAALHSTAPNSTAAPRTAAPRSGAAE